MQRGRLGSDDDSEVGSNESGEGKKAEAAPAKQRAGHDPLDGFKQFLMKKFGTITRAWRVLDCCKQVALNKSEFTSAVRVAGYGGSATVIWGLLGDKRTISLKDIDTETWGILANFYKVTDKRLRGYRNIFFDKDSPHSMRLDFADFKLLCKKAQIDKPHDVLFDLLDVKCVGSITWEEGKYLDEDFRWMDKGVVVALRK